MLLLIPYEIETLRQERPWANWLIVAACSIVSLIALGGGGLAIGLVALQFGWFQLTDCDNRSLLGIIKRENAE